MGAVGRTTGLAALNHPHIAAIYEFSSAEGVQFLVMELVAGESLARRMAAGALPVEEAVDIARQLADGLESAANVAEVSVKPRRRGALDSPAAPLAGPDGMRWLLAGRGPR